MIAKYNGNEYICVSYANRKSIITSKKEKTEAGFTFDSGEYYKIVDEKELTDIYSVDFYVKYETGLDAVEDWWKLENNRRVISDNQVRLVFAKGFLPNWNTIDKNMCSTWVPFDKISGAKMIISYKKRDGVVLDELVIEEKILSIEELRQLHRSYWRECI